MNDDHSPPKNWDKRILGVGGSAVVSLYDDITVLKGYAVWLDGRMAVSFEKWEPSKRSLDRERQVFERLESHKIILRYFGLVEVGQGIRSLRLELASKGNLRSFIRANEAGQVPMSLRLTWVVDLAAGLAHIHSKGVYHCDFSCRNIFLTGENVVKIGDFGGAKLDESDPYDAEEPWYELPLRGRSWEERPYIKRELFALGCAIYEIMAWKKPFTELNPEGVARRFAREEFPNTRNVFCAGIIRKCWNEEFERAEDVMFAAQAVPSPATDTAKPAQEDEKVHRSNDFRCLVEKSSQCQG